MAYKYNEDEQIKSFDFSMLKRSLAYLKPYPFSFFFLFLLGTLSTICFLFFTKVLGNTLDLLLEASSTAFLPKVLIQLFLFLLFGCIFLFFRWKILIKVKTKISVTFRNDLFQKLEALPISYYDNVPHGKIYTRVSQYVDYIVYVLCEVFLDLALQIITFLLVFVFLLFLNVKLTFIVFLFVLGFFLFYLYLTPKWLKVQKNLQNKHSNKNAYLSETLKGVKVTQVFQMEKKNATIFSDLLDEIFHYLAPNCYIGNLGWSLSSFFEILTTIIVYVFGFAFLYPAMSVGSLIVFANYTTHFWDPISEITNVYGSIIEAIDYLKRIYDLLDYEEEKDGKEDILISHGDILLSHVSFSYDGKTEVLHDVSMKIPNGKKIAIVGHTGSGKSTIIQLITRLYEISQGTILIDGYDMKDFSLSSLRSQVMTMNQDGYLFSKSIYENLVLSKKDISMDEVRKICKKIHIDDFIMRLPSGYDTIVEGNGSAFSTGQKQMLSIARILIQNPKIAILDEATSNVDTITEESVVKTFFDVFSNKTTIVIAHRLSTIVDSDLIYVMDHGRLLESGTHDELIQKKGKYYKLYQAQTSDVLN